MRVLSLALAALLASPALRAFDPNDAFRAALLKDGVRFQLDCPSPPSALLVVQKGYLDQGGVSRLSTEWCEATRGVFWVVGRPSKISARVTLYVYGPDDGEAPMSEADVPGAGQGERGIMLRFAKIGREPIFHETTHLLAGSDASQSLSEGLADFVQSRLAPGAAYAFTPAGADPHALARAAIDRYPPAFYQSIGAPGWSGWSSQEVRRGFYFAGKA